MLAQMHITQILSLMRRFLQSLHGLMCPWMYQIAFIMWRKVCFCFSWHHFVFKVRMHMSQLLAFSFSLVYKMWGIWDILAHAHLISLVNPNISGKKYFNASYGTVFSEVNLHFHGLLKIKSHAVSGVWKHLSKTFADYHVNA